MQYTIRSIPRDLDRALRRDAKTLGVSLNRAIIDALRRATGCVQAPMRYHDLDWAIGTWVEDAAFDEAIREQDTVNPDDWK